MSTALTKIAITATAATTNPTASRGCPSQRGKQERRRRLSCIVSGLLRPRVWQLDFFAKASRDLVRQAASLLVERRAPTQGMSSSRRAAGPQIDELGEHIGEVGLRIDAM